jgi:hypothetical protein
MSRLVINCSAQLKMLLGSAHEQLPSRAVTALYFTSLLFSQTWQVKKKVEGITYLAFLQKSKKKARKSTKSKHRVFLM